MSTTIHTIHGWSPSGPDDEDINVSHQLCFMTTIKPLPPTLCPPLDKSCPSLPPLPIPSAPLTGVPRPPIAPSSDRRAQRNRNRDPSWIPRPRNAFIIFRCDYSRDHSHSAHDPHHDPDDPANPSVKTLSKRAADAWKQLLPSERERYKALAESEREEHARLYPHYRFRPMKRQVSGSRKASSSCDRPHAPTSVSVDRPPVPSHFPSVLASAPGNPKDDLPCAPLRPQSPHDDDQRSFASRRSSSVSTGHSLVSPILLSHTREQRSNSMADPAEMAVPPPMQLPPAPLLEPSSFGMGPQPDPPVPPNVDYTYPLLLYSPPEVPFQYDLPAEEYENSIHMLSPLTAATSSLIGWNGELGPPSPSASVHTCSSIGDIPSPLNSSLRPAITEPYSPLCMPSVGIPLDPPRCDDSVYGLDLTHENPEQARALEAYALGLYNHDLLPSFPFPEY